MKMERIYRLLYTIVWPFFNLFYPTKAVGRENIPEGGVVMCGNHSNLSDPVMLCMACTLRWQIRPMAKVELSRVPILGPLLERAGVIYVDRGQADVHAVKTAMKWLKDGGKLLIFPEGTRVHEGEDVAAKSGAALLATRTNSVIVPVYIPRKKKLFRFNRVIFGAPYHPQIAGRKATSEELEKISNDVMERIYHMGEGKA